MNEVKSKKVWAAFTLHREIRQALAGDAMKEPSVFTYILFNLRKDIFWRLMIALVLILVGIYIKMSTPHMSDLLTLLGFAAIVAELYLVWREVREVITSPYEFDSGLDDRYFSSLKPQAHNWTITKICEWVTFSDDINAWLIGEQPKISLKKLATANKYESKLLSRLEGFHEVMALYLADRLRKSTGKALQNQNKIALVNELATGAKEVVIAKTRYFTSLATNDACSQIGNVENEPVLNMTSLFPSAKESGSYRMKSIAESDLSNHIGVSTVMLDPDGVVPLPCQGKGAQRSSGKLAPSGSGSLDWQDQRSATDLLALVRIGVEREFREELGSNQNHDEETLVIGYFRWLRFGGLPQFICISKMTSRYSDLVAQKSEVDRRIRTLSGGAIFTVKQAINGFRAIITGPELGDQGVSVPLAVTAHFLVQVLTGQLGDPAKERVVAFWGLKESG